MTSSDDTTLNFVGESEAYTPYDCAVYPIFYIECKVGRYPMYGVLHLNWNCLWVRHSPRP